MSSHLIGSPILPANNIPKVNIPLTDPSHPFIQNSQHSLQQDEIDSQGDALWKTQLPEEIKYGGFNLDLSDYDHILEKELNKVDFELENMFEEYLKKKNEKEEKKVSEKTFTHLWKDPKNDTLYFIDWNTKNGRKMEENEEFHEILFYWLPTWIKSSKKNYKILHPYFKNKKNKKWIQINLPKNNENIIVVS